MARGIRPTSESRKLLSTVPTENTTPIRQITAHTPAMIFIFCFSFNFVLFGLFFVVKICTYHSMCIADTALVAIKSNSFIAATSATACKRLVCFFDVCRIELTVDTNLFKFCHSYCLLFGHNLVNKAHNKRLELMLKPYGYRFYLLLFAM